MEDNMKKRKREGGPTCRCGLKSDVQIYDFMEDEWVWWCSKCDDEVVTIRGKEVRIAHRHRIGDGNGFIVDVILEGSGDPSEDHDIVGVVFRDTEGKFISGMGDAGDRKIDKIEERGIVR